MAKTGFWLRGAKGKLAGTTMYKDPTTGETIMREVVTPSNPKTEAQLLQRIIMATIGSAYSLSKAITDHSFEGLKAGRETMSYFMKQNINFCREKIASMLEEGLTYYDIFNFLKLGSKGFVPNQYQLSMGSLPQVDASLLAKNISATELKRYGLVGGISENSYAAVINTLGLQRGDQLTFISVEQISVNDSVFKYARVILDPTDPDTKLPLGLDVPFIGENGKINAPSVRNEGDFTFAVETSGVSFIPSVTRQPAGITGCAVIVSRKVGDNWNRSTSYLAYQEGIGYSLGECIDAAADGASVNLYTPNALYLNNAGQGGGVAAASGAESGGTPSVTTPAISSVSVAGQSAVRGTRKVISVAEGTTFPYAVAVNIQTNAAANGSAIAVVNGTEQVATAVVADGRASLNVNAARGTSYAVQLDGAATGYSFSVNEATSGDDGSDE